MSAAPFARRGFLAAIASLTGTSAFRTAPVLAVAAAPVLVTAAVAGPPPDAALIAAGEAWRSAVSDLYAARQALTQANQLFESNVGPCPAELGMTWDERCTYLEAVGLNRGTISCGGKRPMPGWDPGLPESTREVWTNGAHTAATLAAAISLAPTHLGRAGRTPNLIRAWKKLIPIAEARDGVRDAAWRAAGVKQRRRSLDAAKAAQEAARDAVAELPALTFVGLVIKARLAEHEMVDTYEPEDARRHQRPSILSVYDDVLAIGGAGFPMPVHVGRGY